MKFKLVLFLMSLCGVRAAVPSTSCGLPASPADIGPALTTCLQTYGAVELIGYHRLGSTIVMPQGSTLIGRGTYFAVITALPSLTGPMISMDSNVSTTVENIQFQIPQNNAVGHEHDYDGITGVIRVRNTTGNAQFNRIAGNFMFDESKGQRTRYGVIFESTGVYQIAYNNVENNTIFQFYVCLQASGSTTYPVTANRYSGNRTSGVYNLFFPQLQQSSVSGHFCNGFAGAPQGNVCLFLGNPAAVGSSHENLIEIHSDMTGSFGLQGNPYTLYSNAMKNVVTVFSSDGAGTPNAGTSGLPVIVGSQNTVLFK